MNAFLWGEMAKKTGKRSRACLSVILIYFNLSNTHATQVVGVIYLQNYMQGEVANAQL